VCCSMLQYIAARCSVILRCVAGNSSTGAEDVLQCVAVCCSMLQYVAVCSPRKGLLLKMCCSVLQHIAVCCNTLQRVALCRIVLQGVAGCCSVQTVTRNSTV